MRKDNRGFPKVPPKMSKRKKIQSLAELARTVGVDRSYMSRLYMGMSNPSLPVLVKMSKALGVSIDTVIKTLPACRTMPKKTRGARGKIKVSR